MQPTILQPKLVGASLALLDKGTVSGKARKEKNRNVFTVYDAFKKTLCPRFPGVS